MKQRSFIKTINLASHLPHRIIATANREGVPFIETIRNLRLTSNGILEISSWLSSQTVQNLTENRHMTIAAWDVSKNKGFQFIGDVIELNEIGMLDGYSRKAEHGKHLPQVEWNLVFQPATVLDFKQ
jgi:hypothetical protein